MFDFVQKNPVLLGEAPKGERGYPFDWEAWTTNRLAEAVGFQANNIHKYFRPKNLLGEVQPTTPDRFDEFDHEKAVINVSNVIGVGGRVICVGSRVTQTVADFFQIPDEQVNAYIPWCQWGAPIQQHQFARIPHPANSVGRWCHMQGRPSQPDIAIHFLISAIRERYPDAFGHRLEEL